jgi:CheY-like chemotaxis protein
LRGGETRPGFSLDFKRQTLNQLNECRGFVMSQQLTTILIIDDNRSIRQLFRQFLELSGFRVLDAESGPSGLELFHQENPDLVLLDLQMPGMNGYEVLEVIGAESPNTPVVVMSGNGDLSDDQRRLIPGSWDYLPKPVTSLDRFRATIQKTLDRSHSIGPARRLGPDPTEAFLLNATA